MNQIQSLGQVSMLMKRFMERVMEAKVQFKLMVMMLMMMMRAIGIVTMKIIKMLLMRP